MNKKHWRLFLFSPRSDYHWINRFIFLLNSSSDSDSDPEGGELPDIAYPKTEVVQRKKLKKKRSEKMIEERIQKLNRKREVSSDD